MNGGREDRIDSILDIYLFDGHPDLQDTTTYRCLWLQAAAVYAVNFVKPKRIEVVHFSPSRHSRADNNRTTDQSKRKEMGVYDKDKENLYQRATNRAHNQHHEFTVHHSRYENVLSS